MFTARYDLHIHSNYSDGVSSIVEIARQAQTLHLDAIAITDHFWPSMGSRQGGTKIIGNRREEIKRSGEVFENLAILDGAEVDIQSNGSLAPVAGGLDQFDIIIGSFHWVSDSTTWASALIKALQNPQFQILGHWDGYLSSYREADGRIVAQAMADTGIVIELNGKYMSEHNEFLELARDCGCVFSLGSDSHSAETVGQLDYQRKLASDLELELVEPDTLLNLKSA